MPKFKIKMLAQRQEGRIKTTYFTVRTKTHLLFYKSILDIEYDLEISLKLIYEVEN